MNHKFLTTSAGSMVDHSKDSYKTAAQIVGVNRNEDCYKKPIDPNTIKKFYGVDCAEGEMVNAAEEFYADQAGGD